MPVMKHYMEKLTVVHFIGKAKLWDMNGVTPVDKSAYARFYCELIGKWWAVYEDLTVAVA